MGLLSPERGFNGHRVYDESDVTLVWQIRWLFNAGLNSSTTAEILPLVCGRGDEVQLHPALADEVEPTRNLLVEHVTRLTATLRRLDDLQAWARCPRHNQGLGCSA